MGAFQDGRGQQTGFLSADQGRAVSCDQRRSEGRAKELSIEISRKLVELAADGVTDPAQLRRLTLESSASRPGTLTRGFGLVIGTERVTDLSDNDKH